MTLWDAWAAQWPALSAEQREEVLRRALDVLYVAHSVTLDDVGWTAEEREVMDGLSAVLDAAGQGCDLPGEDDEGAHVDAACDDSTRSEGT